MDETTQITRELIISSDVSEVNIVLLEDKQQEQFLIVTQIQKSLKQNYILLTVV